MFNLLYTCTAHIRKVKYFACSWTPVSVNTARYALILYTFVVQVTSGTNPLIITCVHVYASGFSIIPPIQTFSDTIAWINIVVAEIDHRFEPLTNIGAVFHNTIVVYWNMFYCIFYFWQYWCAYCSAKI